MATIPLPKGITGISDLPKSKEHYINLMLSEGGPIRTPGIESLGNGLGACRGAVEWLVDGECYQVSGSYLIRVSSSGTVTSLGVISGSADVVFSQGQANLVIIVKGGDGYYYSSSAGLQQIADPDYLPSVDVDFIDGRHVFIPADGSPAIYSEIDQAGSIEPLAFFDAEELPDKNKAVINVQNQLYIGGEGSFEIFRTNIDPDIVYTRREGARVDVGYAGGKVRFANTFAFLGRMRGEGYRFYLMGSGSATGISNEAIDEILNEEYAAAELEQCDSCRFEYKGIETVVFNLARHSFGFSGGNWFYLDSFVDNQPSVWRGKGIAHVNGKYIIGDRFGSNIGVLKSTQTEYSADTEFELQTFIRSDREANFNLGKIELDCLVGQKLTEQTVGLSISRDGLTWTPFYYVGLGKTGEYKRVVRWQPAGGIGSFESYCGIRIRSTGDIKFGLESVQFT